LNFQGYAAPAGVTAGASFKVRLIYSDPSKNRVFSVPLSTGTGDYQPIQFVLDDTDIVYLTKVKLKFGFKGTSGKLALDGLSLVPAFGARALPVPPPPAG
jgi:hypothetical protein